MRTASLWVPFSDEGMIAAHLIHYPSVNDYVTHWKNGRETFQDVLTYNRYHHMRSGVQVVWSDSKGILYPMIGRYFFELIHLMKQGSLYGTWGYIKRGQTYSLVFNG